MNAILSHVHPHIWRVAAATLAVLVVGSLLRIAALRTAPRDQARSHLDSLRTWWLVVLLVLAATILGRLAVTLLFALASCLGFREFDRLARNEARAGWLQPVILALILGHYGWSGFAPAGDAARGLAWFPLAATMLLAACVVLAGQTQDFTHRVGRVALGLLLTTHCLAHAVWLWDLPVVNPIAGAAGWFLFVVMLTESNDIAQALIGRALGRHKITPQVSPHKTWEGLLGGTASTVVLSLLVGPWLVPGSVSQLAVIGVGISWAGFLGDITMSAAKREAGVKDSSRLLPGQGGLLDRIDSLTFSAPLCYYVALFGT